MARRRARRRSVANDRRLWIALLAVGALVLAYLVAVLNPANERADDIPDTARDAYEQAARNAEDFEHPCHGLEWQVIAGIGRVESKHAEGGQLDDDGLADPEIFGARLDGSGAGGNVTGHGDTDGGELDGDAEYDRAVGPMQFIPSTWEIHGKDGNGDGKADPQNIYDASLAAASLLCGNQERDLSDKDTMRAAIKRYNNSGEYIDQVLTWTERYGG
ncbi:lytic transglycosylase domain-containing protein [Kytococcus sp. Marseille-QA3725]